VKIRTRKPSGRIRPSPNPLRADPSRTGALRRKFEAELHRRWGRLKADLYDLVVREDAFGLAVSGGPPTMVEVMAPPVQPRLILSSFCPTGPGGGVDPSCSLSGYHGTYKNFADQVRKEGFKVRENGPSTLRVTEIPF
jgi:hypothetical protein